MSLPESLDTDSSYDRRVFIIGSEKGFSKHEELNLDTHNFKRVSFGKRVLRVGTATTVLLGFYSQV